MKNEGTKRLIIVSAAAVVVTVIASVATVCCRVFDLIRDGSEA